MAINETLKQLRTKKGINQSETAEELGVSLSSYQKYERDKGCVTPSLDVLIRIADYFGVTTDYLLGREKKEQTAIEQLAGEFDMSALESEILSGYVNLPKEMRGDLMDFLHKAVSNVMEKNKKSAADITLYTANMAAGTGSEGMTDKKINEMEAFAKQVSEYENRS